MYVYKLTWSPRITSGIPVPNTTSLLQDSISNKSSPDYPVCNTKFRNKLHSGCRELQDGTIRDITCLSRGANCSRQELTNVV